MLTRTVSCICLAMVLSAGTALAQGLQFGIKGGLNIASLNFNGGTGPLNPRMGVVAGGFVIAPLTNWIELQADVLYAMKGATIDLGGLAANAQLDYVEFPVLARITRRGRLTYYGAGGPSFGLRVRAKSRVQFAGAVEEIDIGEEVERFDLGLALGGGVEIGALMFDARYTFGFSDIDADRIDGVSIKNRALSVTGGFKF